MKNQRLPALFALIFLGKTLFLQAQTIPPCATPPPPGSESCFSTCVYCNFDGLSGTNNGTPSGGALVCGAISLHNDEWFGFIAGSESVTINIATSNCLNGDGLQVAIFDACSNDALSCNVGQDNGEGQPLVVSAGGLVPGATYFLMVDGYIGDVCDYTIEVWDGSVTPPPVGPIGAISGPTQLCPGAEVIYTISPVEGAGTYTWTAPPGSSINNLGNSINISASQGGTQVTVTMGASGGNICVRAVNPCSTPQSTCLPVTVTPVPPTVLPDIVLCANDLPFEWMEAPNNTILTSGTHNLTSTPYDNFLGCDSLVKQKIIVRQPIVQNIGVQYVCEGDCFQINGNEYCQPGLYEEKFTSAAGCDSTVKFTVQVILVDANIAAPQPISCASLQITVSSAGSIYSGAPGFTWTNANGTVVGNGGSVIVNTPGVYQLVLSATSGTKTCRDSASVTVTSNGVIPTAVATGGNITCLSPSLSTILSATSNLPGVTFQWSGPGINASNQNFQNPSVNLPGTYIVTVTNPANGCAVFDTVSVSSNITPPVASAAGGTITCLQSSALLDLTIDTSPISVVWSGPGINASNQNLEDPTVSQSGTYNVVVTNPANGCTATATATVGLNNTLPTANAGPDQALTCLQPTVTLNGSGNGTSIVWAGPGISPASQTSPTQTINQAGVYVLTITNTNSGCVKKDTVVVANQQDLPTATAGPNQTIDCKNATVTLNGSGSSQGPNFTATWSGPGINASNSNTYSPTVDAMGSYNVLITNTSNGCTSTAQVTVGQDIAQPSANAGADVVLTCTSQNGVSLQGSGTPSGLEFFWTGPGIGANNQTLQSPSVSLSGLYQLVVTNPANGCTDSDEVNVSQDANVPVANANQDLTINCLISSVNLSGSGSSSGAGINYAWSGPNGFSSTQLNPANITTAGTYTLTVVNTNNNCQNSDIVVIGLDQEYPDASAGPDLVLDCKNGGSDTLDASGSDNGNVFQTIWSGPGITPQNANQISPIVSQPGIYTLTVTNTKNGCVSTAQATVSADLAAPNAAAGNDQTIDCVVTLATIGGNAPNNNPAFQYVWTGPGINASNMNSKNPVVGQPGTYTLEVTNLSNGCSDSDEVEIVLDAVYPLAEAGFPQTINCLVTSCLIGVPISNMADLEITWIGAGISPANANQAQPQVTEAGTYIIKVENTSNHCVAFDTVTISSDVDFPEANAGANQLLNCETSSVTLDGSQSTSGANIFIQWSGSGIHAGNQSQISPSISQPGIYTIAVLNTANGCESEDQVTISQNINVPMADAGADLVLTCLQNMAAINASGSSVGAGFSYFWTGPGISSLNVTSQNPTVGDSGTYTLTVTDLNSRCTASDQVLVALDGQFPVADAGPAQTLTCTNKVANLVGAQSSTGPDFTYIWSGPGIVSGQNALQSPQVNQPGVYLLTVTDTNNGCSKTDDVQVLLDEVPPFANANGDQILTCSSNSATLSSIGSSSGSGFEYLWQGAGIDASNQNSANPSVAQAGTYSLIVTNLQNGCTASDEVVVSLDQNIPVVSAGQDQQLTCLNQSATLSGSGISPTGTLTFLWSGPGISPANQNDQTPNVLLPGNYTLVVTNTSTNCSATDQVLVSEDKANPAVTISSDTITCADPIGNIVASSDLPGSTFSWEGPGIPTGSQTGPTVNSPQNGIFTVTVTAQNGCTSIGTIELVQDDDFPAGIAEGTVLNCLNGGASNLSSTVTTPNANFSWTGPQGFASSLANPEVTVPGTYRFVIQADNGCEKTINVTVSGDFQQPNVLAKVDGKIDCNTTSLLLDGSGSSVGTGFDYIWSGPGIISGANGLSPEVDQPGNYQLLILDRNNGCSDSAMVLVELDPSVPTAFHLVATDIRCFGEKNGKIQLISIENGTEPFEITVNGSPTNLGNSLSQLSSGDYLIQLTDANGCRLDTTVAIAEPPALTLELGPDVDLKLGDSTQVVALIAASAPLASVVWDPNPPCDMLCTEFFAKPFSTIRYKLEIRDSNGCVAQDQLLIKVDKDRNIYVPNIFNPQSDINNLVMVHASNRLVKNIRSFQIFDRWGEAVFEVKDAQPNDTAKGWDGKAKDGKYGANAVYVWYAEIEFVDGEVRVFKGDVALARQ